MHKLINRISKFFSLLFSLYGIINFIFSVVNVRSKMQPHDKLSKIFDEIKLLLYFIYILHNTVEFIM